MFLVALDGEDCDAERSEAGDVPECPTIDLMVANRYAFEVGSHPDGYVDEESDCRRSFAGK